MPNRSKIKTIIERQNKLNRIIDSIHKFWIKPKVLIQILDTLDQSMKEEAKKPFNGFDERSKRDLENLEFNSVIGVKASDIIVWVDVDKLDKSWKKSDDGCYVYPGGVEGVEGKYDYWIRYLEEHCKPIEMSKIGMTDGKAGFVDGRHRFVIMRDVGVKRVPVITDKRCLLEINRIASF